MTAEAPKATATILAALGEPTRVRIVAKLAAGGLCVTDLATALKVEIVNISHHLNLLRNAGLVDGRKDGRHVIYSLTDAEASATDVTLRRPGVSVTLEL